MSENVKYTKSGKKVAVLGRLNDAQWIVQEIFVAANGQEFPGGENFTESGLLDKPAETWQAEQVREYGERKARIEGEITALGERQRKAKTALDVSELVARCVRSYQKIDTEELWLVFAFLAGEITHVVTVEYDTYSIKTIDEALGFIEHDYGRANLQGLKLLSLFGVCGNGLRSDGSSPTSLQWRINQYRDGSGDRNYEVYPCRSHAEAVAKLDALISKNELATKGQIAAKEEYALINPSAEKIAAYTAAMVEVAERELANAKAVVAKKAAELQAIKGGDGGAKDVTP